MAANGQCLYYNINSADAVIYVGRIALKKPFPPVLSINQHNYNPIKGPVELCLHCVPDTVLFVFGFGIKVGKLSKTWREVCEKKYNIGFGIFEYWSDLLSGWFG